MTPLYRELMAESTRFDEDDDCTVRAVAAVFDAPYSIAHDLMERHDGRKHREGSWFNNTLFILANSAGVEVRMYPPSKHVTVPVFARTNAKGRFIVYIHSYGGKLTHVIPIVNGTIHDRTAWRGCKVRFIWEIKEVD